MLLYGCKKYVRIIYKYNIEKNETRYDFAHNRRRIGMDTNLVHLSGCLLKEPVFSHEMFGNQFYQVDLVTERHSGTTDTIPLLFARNKMVPGTDCKGRMVSVTGEFRSRNYWMDGRTHLMLYVLVKELDFLDGFDEVFTNTIHLDGTLCKEPVFRTTPLLREITDLLIATNNSNGKESYLPCICWGQVARTVARFCVGKRLSTEGRIQSRLYRKRLSDGTAEERIAYEVSIAHIAY